MGTVLAQSPSGSLRFALKAIPFHLENDQTAGYNAPETMAGGVAIFDYNRDGRPDIFFTNGADIATLKKDSPKYSNRLFRNDGDGKFTDVTESAGLAGTGYDIGVAVGDYDNDGYPDLFVAGVHRNTLYHNNRRWHVHGRHFKSGTRTMERSRVWPALGSDSSLGRCEQ